MFLTFFSSPSHSFPDRAPEAAGITASERPVQVTEEDVRLGLVEHWKRDWFGWLRWVGW